MTPRAAWSLTLLGWLAVASSLTGMGFGLALGWSVGGARGSFIFVVAGILSGTLLALLLRALKILADEQRVLQKAFEGTIQSVAAAIDMKDSYPATHASLVSHYAQAITRALRLPADDLQVVRLASSLHNIGKVGIADHLLLKAGPLDEQEWAAVRRHVLIADRILQSVPIDERVKMTVRHCYERWDGSGYPDGLAGEEIPIHARVLLIAEAYGAMSSDRPYRKAKGASEAQAELRRGAGAQFDPRIVEVFMTVLEREATRAWVLGPVMGEV